MQKGRHSLKYRRIQQDLMALVFQLCQLDVLPEAGRGSAIRLTQARRCQSSLPPTIMLIVARSATALTWSMGERVATGP